MYVFIYKRFCERKNDGMIKTGATDNKCCPICNMVWSKERSPKGEHLSLVNGGLCFLSLCCSISFFSMFLKKSGPYQYQRSYYI